MGVLGEWEARRRRKRERTYRVLGEEVCCQVGLQGCERGRFSILGNNCAAIALRGTHFTRVFSCFTSGLEGGGGAYSMRMKASCPFEAARWLR